MKHIATVINNNQPGWTNIVETEPNVTLDVGTKLYTESLKTCVHRFTTKPGELPVAITECGERYSVFNQTKPIKSCPHCGGIIRV
ncbi:MAG: hypothetical protein WBB23_06860 [Desulforhopalus sp.]